jgi:cytidylate kinase
MRKGNPLVVAIDGPAGAGKSAAARELARRLRVAYLDTGATYRVVALAAIRAGMTFPLSAGEEVRAAAVAAAVERSLRLADGGRRVIFDEEDVTERIRTPEVSQAASMVSAVPGVRRAMVELQRRLASAGGVVEGRDIGTVVLPGAPLKVFLTAAAEVRARRRFEELRRTNPRVAWEAVLAEQRERDTRDATRADSPLRPAAGAIILDTSTLTLAEVVERLYHLAQDAVKRLRGLDSSAPPHV